MPSATEKFRSGICNPYVSVKKVDTTVNNALIRQHYKGISGVASNDENSNNGNAMVTTPSLSAANISVSLNTTGAIPCTIKKNRSSSGKENSINVSPRKELKDRIDSKTTTAKEKIKNAVESSVSALVIAASDKAGMEGIDRSRIDSIILRESGNSLYMKQQRERDEKVNERIEKMKKKLLEIQQQYQEKNKNNNNSTNNNNWKKRYERMVDEEFNKEDVEASKPSRSTCVVVDMDMFFMACELLTRPELRNVPACVGGSMISTSNYCARKYGVRSAMAGWIGDKLVEELSGGKCKLVHVPSNFPLYKEKSNIVQHVLSQFDPNLSVYSLDEAFLNVGPYIALRYTFPNWTHEQIYQALKLELDSKSSSNSKTETISSPQKNNGIAQSNKQGMLPQSPPMEQNQQTHAQFRQQQIQINRQQVHQIVHNYKDVLDTIPQNKYRIIVNEVVACLRNSVCESTGGLTCSAGIAPSIMLAKIASDKNKPNGQYFIDVSLEHDILPFLNNLSIRKIPGIGRVTEKMLHAFDISTVDEIWKGRAIVKALFLPATCKSLLRSSLGGFHFHKNKNVFAFGSNDHNNNIENSSSSHNEEDNNSQKGMSRERTFSPISFHQLSEKIHEIANLLSYDMQRKKVYARTITMKIKLHTFHTVSRSKTVSYKLFQSPSEIIIVATQLLAEIQKECCINNNHHATATTTKASAETMITPLMDAIATTKTTTTITTTTTTPNLPCSSSPPPKVRLIGIRCSNLVTYADAAGDGNQTNIEQFLCSNRDQSRATSAFAVVVEGNPTAVAMDKPAKENRTENDKDKTDFENFDKKNNRIKISDTKIKDDDNSINYNCDDSATNAPENDTDGNRSLSPCGQQRSLTTTTDVENFATTAIAVTPCADAPVTAIENVEESEKYAENANFNKNDEIGSINSKIVECVIDLSTSNDKDDKYDTDDVIETVVCPLCRRPITEGAEDNQAVNRHIDSCLNGVMIRKVVKEHDQSFSSSLSSSPLSQFLVPIQHQQQEKLFKERTVATPTAATTKTSLATKYSNSIKTPPSTSIVGLSQKRRLSESDKMKSNKNQRLATDYFTAFSSPDAF